LRKTLNFLGCATVLALGACSAMPDFESFRAPSVDNMLRPLSVTNYREKVLPPVPADDLVDASGRCAGAFIPAAGGDPNAAQPLPDAGVPMIPSGISLQMSECDVVKRAGVAERVDINKSPAGERLVTMSYLGGERAGVYQFSNGRLKSMERGPEPPPEVAKKPAKKPPPRARQRTAVQVQ
jgi:hypothetical protein